MKFTVVLRVEDISYEMAEGVELSVTVCSCGVKPNPPCEHCMPSLQAGHKVQVASHQAHFNQATLLQAQGKGGRVPWKPETNEARVFWLRILHSSKSCADQHRKHCYSQCTSVTVLLTLEQRRTLSYPLLAAAGAAVQYTDALASDTLASEAEKSARSCSCCRCWHQALDPHCHPTVRDLQVERLHPSSYFAIRPNHSEVHSFLEH